MTTPTIIVEQPGVYLDMPDAVYHADPVPAGSLSVSGARKLLPPNCPARFKYDRDSPPQRTEVFEFGHASHHEVLGVGPQLVLVERDRWDTNAVKAEVAAIREAGGVPLKRDQYERVQAMAAALRAHPYAGPLFAPGTGTAEVSIFWVDGPSGVWRRSRLDWLRHPIAGRRLIVPDYKTCDCADPETLQRTINNYGYHRQGAWYLDAVRAVGLDAEPVFVLVFQEKEPPYLVTIAEPDPPALRIGAALNREAIDVYRRCVAEDRWPGYADDNVTQVGLPAYVENRHLREIW